MRMRTSHAVLLQRKGNGGAIISKGRETQSTSAATGVIDDVITATEKVAQRSVAGRRKHLA
jgi:hypothetical protein